jgi:two-component system LytT family response regulator
VGRAVLETSGVTHFFSKDKLTFAAVEGREHVVDHSLVELATKLDPRRFVRIHRNAIVNVSFVQELHPSLDAASSYDSETSAEPSSRWRDRVRELKERLGI